jgi:hypothetical protein
MAALFIAIIGAVITCIGFGYAKKFKLEIISIIAKFGALAIGFLSMPALESLFQVKGVGGAAGGYWFYILFGVWVLSQIFKDPGQARR